MSNNITRIQNQGADRANLSLDGDNITVQGMGNDVSREFFPPFYKKWIMIEFEG